MADLDLDLEALVVLAKVVSGAVDAARRTQFDGTDASLFAGHAAVASALSGGEPAWKEHRGSIARDMQGIGDSLLLIASEFELADSALARITSGLQSRTVVTRLAQ